jgi:hypothetical protein
MNIKEKVLLVKKYQLTICNNTVTLVANDHSDLHGLFVAVHAFPTSFWCGIHDITINC